MIKLLRKAQTMLSWRTPFWLFIFCVCAVIMTVFTVKYFPQGDVRSVRSSLLPYNRLDTDEIIIKFPETQEEIKCVKKSGIWYVDDGYLVRANADRISLLFNALIGDSIRERITKRQRERRELTLDDFGLEKYNTELILKRGKDKVSIIIGDDAPYEDTVFVKADTSSEVYIVSGVLRDIIPLNIDDIRDKTLFPHSVSLINKVEIISGEENSFVVEKEVASGEWEMISPVRAPASMAIDSLIQSLGFSSINSFVWHPIGKIVSKKTISDYVSPYGLDIKDAPSIIRLWMMGKSEPVEIRIGRALPNDSGLVYAFSTIDNSVFTLDQTTIAPFLMGYETMRNHSIFTVPIHNIASFSYKNGNEFCLLTLNDVGEWELSIPSKQPVEIGAAESFVSSLSQITDSGIAPDNISLPTSYIELIFTDRNEKATQLNFYYDNATHPTNVYLKATTSSFITKVSPNVLPQGFLDKNFAASFRSHEIFNFEPTKVQEFSLIKGNSSQSAYYTPSGDWRSRDYVNGSVASETIISIINQISTLKAEWVAKLFVTDINKYGFDTPQVEALIVFSSDIEKLPNGMPTVIIQIGKQLPTGDYYLRIKGGEELFVVSEEFAKALLEAKLY